MIFEKAKMLLIFNKFLIYSLLLFVLLTNALYDGLKTSITAC